MGNCQSICQRLPRMFAHVSPGWRCRERIFALVLPDTTGLGLAGAGLSALVASPQIAVCPLWK